MKKKYIAPNIKVREITTGGMLMSSILGTESPSEGGTTSVTFGGTIDDNESFNSKYNNSIVWDDEEE